MLVYKKYCKVQFLHKSVSISLRDRLRFFDQVGHQTTNASIGNKYFSLNNVILRLTKIMNRAKENWAHF